MNEHTSTENSKPKKITKDQSRDTGMAIVLLLLLVFLARKREGWLFAAMAVRSEERRVGKEC